MPKWVYARGQHRTLFAPTYLAMGPIPGPGTIERIVTTFAATSGGTFASGFTLARGPDETQVNFREGICLTPFNPAHTASEGLRSLVWRASATIPPSPFELPVERDIGAGPAWIIWYFEPLATVSSFYAFATIEVRRRRGVGRRGGDVPVQVAPRGAEVLQGLQREARRAAGRDS